MFLVCYCAVVTCGLLSAQRCLPHLPPDAHVKERKLKKQQRQDATSALAAAHQSARGEAGLSVSNIQKILDDIDAMTGVDLQHHADEFGIESGGGLARVARIPTGTSSTATPWTWPHCARSFALTCSRSCTRRRRDPRVARSGAGRHTQLLRGRCRQVVWPRSGGRRRQQWRAAAAEAEIEAREPASQWRRVHRSHVRPRSHRSHHRKSRTSGQRRWRLMQRRFGSHPAGQCCHLHLASCCRRRCNHW